jgi:hypothetical protein
MAQFRRCWCGPYTDSLYFRMKIFPQYRKRRDARMIAAVDEVKKEIPNKEI